MKRTGCSSKTLKRTPNLHTVTEPQYERQAKIKLSYQNYMIIGFLFAANKK